MNTALTTFASNLNSARQLGVIYAAFEDQVTAAIDLDELLRAEIVLVVSALDCYIHDVVRMGMTRVLPLASGEPDAYLNFGVSMGFLKNILRVSTTSDRVTLLDAEIRRVHGYQTFQNADKISQAVALIGVQALWSKVGAALAMSSADVRTRLNLIVDRRNKIAHEGDIDPTGGAGTKYPIDLPTVQAAVDLVESVVHSAHTVICSEVTF